MANVQYVLTTKDFFSEGSCGRVSHASGFVHGCLENGASVELVSEKNSTIFFSNAVSNLCLKTFKKFNQLLLMLYVFRNASSHESVVIRWRPLIPFFYFGLFFINKNCWLEINSVTGADSRWFAVRWFSKLSISISTRFFNLIVVSDKSLSVVKGMARIKRKAVVMPNGFFPECFIGMQPNISKAKAPSLVYFGKKQSYYDWDVLYSVSKLLIEKKWLSGFHVFGFDDFCNFEGIVHYGRFSQHEISRKLESIENPILVLHAADSEVARSGSPMKLFEYGALGLPVVISDSLKGQAARFELFNFYKAGDVAELTECIQSVCKEYFSIQQASLDSRRVALDNYTWKAVTLPWLFCSGVLAVKANAISNA